jgi:hypothetical protein
MSEDGGAAVASPPSALVELAKQYAQKESAVEFIEKNLKEVKAERDAIERRLVDEMVTQHVRSFKVDEHGGFRTQAVVYPNVVDREKLNAHVVKNKKKLGFLYTVSVNGTKLKSFVKELMEQGKPVPPGVEPYVATEIRRFK